MKYIYPTPGTRFPQLGRDHRNRPDYLRTNWLGCISTSPYELELKGYEPPPHIRYFDEALYENIVYWIVCNDLQDEVIFLTRYDIQLESEIKIIGFYSEKWLQLWLLTDFYCWRVSND